MKGIARYLLMSGIGLICTLFGMILSVVSGRFNGTTEEWLLSLGIASAGIGLGICVNLAVLSNYISDERIKEDNGDERKD